MLTTAIIGTSTFLPVGGTPGSLDNVSNRPENLGRGWWWDDLQPVDVEVVRELVNKLINHPIYANGAADQRHLCIRRIAEDEMFSIKAGQRLPSNASGQLWTKS